MKVMLIRARFVAVLALASLSAASILACAQEPPPPAPEPSAPAESSTAKAAKHTRHVDGFLIRGTVFSDKALSLPGAELHIRRTGEKRFRWSTNTNSRGEFAIRVPPGADYELVVQSKGFADVMQPVDAKSGLSEDNMVIRMPVASGGKR
jgi:hypothetical protein